MTTPRPTTIGVRLTNYENKGSLGYRLRQKRAAPLMALIQDAHKKYGKVDLLDVGGRKLYWQILPQGFLEQHAVTVTLLNLPDDIQEEDDRTFRFVVGNACDLSQYSDASFHIAHSNSVIEHVGGWKNVKLFANEIRRVAQGLFVQTPYFWFPIEPHYVMPFLHWVPRPIQESLVLKLPLGHKGKRADSLEAAIAEIDEVPRLLDNRAYQLLFPDCEILKERFLLFTKSMIAYRNLRDR